MIDIDKHKNAITLLPEGSLHIGGELVNQSSGGSCSHVNPSTGEVQKDFLFAGEKEVNMAVTAAHKALPTWWGLSSSQRRDALLKIAFLLEQERESLSVLTALDNGTPVSLGGPLSSDSPADWFRYYAGWADKVNGEVVPTSAHQLIYSSREPYGVVACIVAFNAPMSFMGLKVAAALAGGNTVVIKPSELAPWAVLRFAEICVEAGIPPGVINVVPGNADAGSALVNHPLVDKVTFTGGENAAKSVLSAAANTLKPSAMELGGKSAGIVFNDADIDMAVQTALQTSVIVQSGQACVAGSRLLVQEDVYDTVIDRIEEILQGVKIGDPLSPDTMMGPLISEFHCHRVLNVIERARSNAEGKLVCGGERAGGGLSCGYFLTPALFRDVPPDCQLSQEEIFGPVLSVSRFKNEAQAVDITNNTRYGLSCYIYTTDLNRVHRLTRAVRVGTLAVNSPNLFSPAAPFGGMKASGFGREGGYDGIFEMTQAKTVQIGLSQDLG